MKRYMIVYKPLNPQQQAIRLVPVVSRDLERAIRMADHIMEKDRKLNVADFSTKYTSRKNDAIG